MPTPSLSQLLQTAPPPRAFAILDPRPGMPGLFNPATATLPQNIANKLQSYKLNGNELDVAWRIVSTESDPWQWEECPNNPYLALDFVRLVKHYRNALKRSRNFPMKNL